MDKRIAVFVLIGALLAMPVLADEQTFTVTFSIPSSISHSLSYGTVDGTCTNSVFYFRESDGTIDGSQTHINASDASGQACQNGTVSALTVTNGGNANINVSELYNATVTGVDVYVSQSGANMESVCADDPVADCVTLSTSPATVATDVAASSSVDLWHWANFSNADLGAGPGNSTSAERLFTTNATAS